VVGTLVALSIGSLLLWLRARQWDRTAQAAYQKRTICPDCDWKD
jgi:hypothetical protein